MEAIVEILLELVGEVLLQVVFEAIAGQGVHSVRNPMREPPEPWLAGIGYVVLGALAGAISLWLVPTLFVRSPVGRIANLVLAPVLAGAAMAAIGAWRRRRDQELIRLDKFAYGYLFALSMALVRFELGR